MRDSPFSKSRITLADCAISTMLKEPINKSDYASAELLTITDPQAVLNLHLFNAESGADLLTTNSFATHPLILKETGSKVPPQKIAAAAASIAAKVAGCRKNRIYVAGSLGPLPPRLFLDNDITREEVVEGYISQGETLLAEGADFLLFETIYDLRCLEPILEAVQQLKRKTRETAVAFTFALPSHPSISQLENVVKKTASLSPLYLGLNCSPGALEMIPLLNSLERLTDLPLSASPSAAPIGSSVPGYLTPDLFLEEIKQVIKETEVSIIGGCCGTSPAHTALMFKEIVQKQR